MDSTIKDFEAAIAELESIVKKLEEGDLPLETSLQLYERGVQLSRFCHARLEEAERRPACSRVAGNLVVALVPRFHEPGAVLALNGMVVVAFIEPQARLVHVTMGLPLVVGGWAEHRYRLGEISRKVADAFIVPALLLAAFDTLAFHLDGPPGVVYSHLALGIMVIGIAAARLYQSARPESLGRATLISFTIVAMSGTLLIDSFVQPPV